MDDLAMWKRFKSYLCVAEAVGVSVDPSRMKFSEGFLQEKDAEIRRAFVEMEKLEAGAIANPDEHRMVGHYWLRDSAKAPTPELRQEIDACLAGVKKFARAVHAGTIKPQKARVFRNVLVVGIGGSALGPQFVARALGSPSRDKIKPYFFDNTDPDGMDLVLSQIGAGLKETLCVVISKSGGTKESRNGMLEAKRAFEAAGLRFEPHAVAVTGVGSDLDTYAVEHRWLARFPMWDWVGGRTSELSAVGLLPAALQGLDIQGMLNGARAMDEVTRAKEPLRNPAALLALMWYHAGGGRGAKDMVILPYKDRLELFSRYLQQLVMESLGKEHDLNGRVVNQGIAVYGNKGSTDQHAYVQQLRDGVNNFFVTFIEVLKDRGGKSMEVEPGATSGDYLSGFHQGTRKALFEKDRESITVTVPDVSPQTVGKLIALYERAVGFYGTLVNINAYHQPGVEAGKKAAAGVLALQGQVVRILKANKGKAFTVDQLADEIGAKDEVETVFKVLQHLAANRDHGVKRSLPAGASVFSATYSA
ncbi:MAG: glucose-6-phosphate isomerase [Candidatus Rokubacteria bacterium]|nr:glucose-6-phosphate isomerase [Candidatus Rokubacteria bacterium]